MTVPIGWTLADQLLKTAEAAGRLAGKLRTCLRPAADRLKGPYVRRREAGPHASGARRTP